MTFEELARVASNAALEAMKIEFPRPWSQLPESEREVWRQIASDVKDALENCE